MIGRTIKPVYQTNCISNNKTPAQAFTPPAEKKIGQSGHLCTTAQAGNMKSGYLRIFNILTRAITRDLTREFFFK